MKSHAPGQVNLCDHGTWRDSCGVERPCCDRYGFSICFIPPSAGVSDPPAPRACGDGPAVRDGRLRLEHCFPRTRGWSRSRSGQAGRSPLHRRVRLHGTRPPRRRTALPGPDRTRGENSVAIASNESFGGWTKTFTDPRLCAAIVDRLNGTIVETGTDSYRLASARAQAERAAGWETAELRHEALTGFQFRSPAAVPRHRHRAQD